MKVVLFLHELVIAGTSVNAIELATKLRDLRGFEVIVFAPHGPMLELVREAGLRYVPAPHASMHPSIPRMRALRELVRAESPDLIYVWETWALLDAFYGVHLPMRVPLLATDMQMFLARVLPRRVSMTFGTLGLVDAAKTSGIRDVRLLVPPVDLLANSPSTHDPARSRAEFSVVGDDILLVIVSRLAHAMKGESLRLAVEAVDAMGERWPVRLLIVGDGPARPGLEVLAHEVNTRLGRTAVSLTGALLDPRPAYAAADIVIGMGSSALRGMAHGKPVVVVGEAGFAATLRPESAGYFDREGLYGKGGGEADRGRLRAEVEALLGSPATRTALGEFALDYVRRQYALDLLANQLGDFCESVSKRPPSLRGLLGDALRTTAIYLRERRFLWRAPALPPSPTIQPDSSATETQAITRIL